MHSRLTLLKGDCPGEGPPPSLLRVENLTPGVLVLRWMGLEVVPGRKIAPECSLDMPSSSDMPDGRGVSSIDTADSCEESDATLSRYGCLHGSSCLPMPAAGEALVPVEGRVSYSDVHLQEALLSRCAVVPPTFWRRGWQLASR